MLSSGRLNPVLEKLFPFKGEYFYYHGDRMTPAETAESVLAALLIVTILAEVLYFAFP